MNRLEHSIEEIVEASFEFAHGYFSPCQFKSEIVAFLRAIEQARPRQVVEIGTAFGGTLFLLSRVASADATLISVDLPGGPWGGGYSIPRGMLFRLLKLPTQRLHLIRADSHDARSRRSVQNLLTGSGCDVLFVDGDHSYEAVKSDFLMYGSLVRDGGYIAFHDIVPPSEHFSDIQVNRFWNEIKSDYPYLEYVEDWSQGTFGIGIIVKVNHGLPRSEIAGPQHQRTESHHG